MYVVYIEEDGSGSYVHGTFPDLESANQYCKRYIKRKFEKENLDESNWLISDSGHFIHAADESEVIHEAWAFRLEAPIKED